MTSVRLAVALCLGMALLAVQPAWAQQSDQPGTDLATGEAVEVVGSDEPAPKAEEAAGTPEGGASGEVDLGVAVVLGRRTLAAILGDTRALTVIDAAELRTARTVGEVLEAVPGLDVRMLGGVGQASSVQIRGARGNQALVLLDGVPIAAGEAELDAIPAGSIDRIEVLRGPEAARFGAGALGGVVNIVTHASPAKPAPAQSLLPLNEHMDEIGRGTGGRQISTSAETTVGTLGVKELGLSLDAPDSSWYAGVGEARNDYAFRLQGGAMATRQNNDSRQLALLGSWRTPGAMWRAGLRAYDRGVPGSAEFPTLRARLRQEAAFAQAAGGDWRAAFLVQHTRFRDPEPYLHSGPLATEDTRLHAEYALGTLAVQRGRWGVKPYADYVTSREYGEHLRLGMDAHRTWDSIAASSHWQLDASLLSASDQGVHTALRAGVSRPLGSATSIYAGAGYAVRFPDFAELYLSGTGSVKGNPALKPERALSAELGVRHITAGTQAEAALFGSQYYESIIFAPVSAYLVQAVNTGRAQVAGAEAHYDKALARGWEWRSSGTWLAQAQYASGVPLTGRARVHATTALSCNTGPWRTAVSLDYTGRIPADLFGSLTIKPRAVCAVEAGRDWHGGHMSLRVDNVFDRAARDSWNYPLPGRAVFFTYEVEL